MVINSFENRNCMEQMGRCNTHSKAPNNFFGDWGWGGEIFFFGVPTCSDHIPKKVPMSSNLVLQIFNVLPKDITNNPWFETHVFWPKSSPSHLYRWAKRGGSPFKRGTLGLVIHRARFNKKTCQKKISIQSGVKLRKPSTLVINWISSCFHDYYIYFHYSYLYDYYNYIPTLCIKCWNSTFHTKI